MPSSHLATGLTLIRLGLLPLLWAFALAGRSGPVGVGLVIAGITDILDGPAARRAGRASARGSRLDSIADLLVFASMIGWLGLLRGEHFAEHVWLMLGGVALGLAALGVSLAKFRRFVDLHLYSSKAAVFCAYLFVVWTMLFGGWPAGLFYLAVATAYLTGAEVLLVLLTRRQVDERLGSILLRRDRPGGGV